MKSNNFREQVSLVTSWFKDWNECEQTVALYSLLKKSSPVQAKFLDQILQQSLADCTDVKQLEVKANDEAYVRSLYSEEKELVIRQLLQLLPLLQVGKTSAKLAYLQLIPELLNHTIHKGVNIEESRQLLSYSLIHPAITTEERGTFQTWLGCLEERFTYSLAHTNSGNNNGGGGGGSGTTTNSSSGSTSNHSLNVGLSHRHSPSPGSSSQHSLAHMSPDVSSSVSQEYSSSSGGVVAGMVVQQQQQQQQSPVVPSHASPSPVIGSGAQASWQHQKSPCQYVCFDASAAINPPVSNGDTSGCAQLVPVSNGHLTLRAANSHAGAFGASQGHLPLHATSSAPPNFNSIPRAGPSSQGQASSQNSHAPLTRTHSITPPVRLQNSEKTVSDWLKTNHGHHHHHHHHIQQQATHQGQLHGQHLAGCSGSLAGGHPILAPRCPPPYPEHAPLSPQSSLTSSGSGGSDSHQHDDGGPQPMRDSFLEDGSGMREVPVWLKTLRLHKYAYLFRQMTYEEMLNVTEDLLEQQNVTKGARHKIYISISSLRERQGMLKTLEKSIVDEGGPIKSALEEMRAMLNTPIKAFSPSQQQPHHPSNLNNNPAFRTSSTSSSSTTTTSSSPPSPTVDEVVEGDLPAQFCRLMGKVYTQLLVASRPDDECFQIYLQLIDKCLNHEAFSDRQKKLLLSWKLAAQRIWQPPPQKYGDRSRRGYGNTFHSSTSLGSRIIPRAARIPVPQTTYHHQQQQQQHPSMQQWSFGSKRSILGGANSGGGGHIQVQRNSSLNTAFLNKPGLLEQTKQPISRTHSAPIHRPLSLSLQGSENANDTEINARLDSLCISMTEHALGSSDTTERGPAY